MKQYSELRTREIIAIEKMLNEEREGKLKLRMIEISMLRAYLESIK